MRLFIVYISPPAHRPPICGPRIIIPSPCVLVGPRRRVIGSLTAASAIFNFHFRFWSSLHIDGENQQIKKNGLKHLHSFSLQPAQDPCA